MELIFQKFAFDPNGWIRHFTVGFFILLYGIFKKKIPISFIVCLILALLKETYDTYYGMGTFYFDNASKDIFFTILPYGIYITLKYALVSKLE